MSPGPGQMAFFLWKFTDTWHIYIYICICSFWLGDVLVCVLRLDAVVFFVGGVWDVFFFFCFSGFAGKN